ncbi:glycosyltransferase [bacterium]|nr:MAG: glycosyltransferase [bacterium]
MKILMVGEFFRGALSESYFEAFQQLDCQVKRFDEVREFYKNIPGFRYSRYLYLDKTLGIYFLKLLNSELLRVARDFRPDLCIIFKGYRIFPETILKIKKDTQAVIFNINADDPLSRNWGASSKMVKMAIHAFDCYFIWSKYLTKKLKEEGLGSVRYLPFAFDPEIHCPQQLSFKEQDELGHELVFVGGWDERREALLGNLDDFDLAIWGAWYWGRRCSDKRLVSRWQGKPVLAQMMSKVLCASKISLNIFRPQNIGSINMRTFEAPACGTFALAERSPEAATFFQEDKEVVYFSGARELKEKASYYLAHEEERRQIAQAAYQRCLKSNYSYLDRAKEVLDFYREFSLQRQAQGQKKYRVAIVSSHIIQYAIPLYRVINASSDIGLNIFFCSKQGLISKLDPGFKEKISWDNIDLDSLHYKFIKNYSPFAAVDRTYGLINLGIIGEIKRGKFDAVIIGGYFLLTFWLAFYAAYISKTPIILTGEPPSPYKSRLRILIMNNFKRLFLPRLIDKASAILYIGQKSKEYYLSFRRDIGEKLFFCPYSVDNDFYFSKAKEYSPKKDELKKELGVPLELPVILFLSKLIHWKRPMFLLETFARLNIPSVLVYVGSGYRYKALKKFVAKENIKNVVFFGFQNYTQIPKFYAIADIFVFPSLGESWGLVVNEAMCFGLPIITTDRVMSSYDLVRHGENGYIVKPEDKQDFQNRLEYLLSHPEERKKMGAVSLEIINKWNYSEYLKGLLSALDYIKKK